MAQEMQVAQQRNNPKSEGRKRKRSRNRNRRRKNKNVEKLEVGNNKAQQNKKLEERKMTNSKQQENSKKRSVKETKRRSVKDTKRRSVKETKRRSVKETKRRSVKESQKKSVKDIKKMSVGDKKCLSCKPTESKVANTYKKRADWKAERGLRTIFPNDKIPPLDKIKLVHPPKSNQFVKIKLGSNYGNRYVLYYASKNSNIDKLEKVRDADNAYSQFENRGIAKTDLEGEATLKMRCPQVYKEEGETYFSHVHFIISNKEKTEWINELKTQTVVCEITHKEMYKVVKHNSALVVNALPIKYFIQERIPGSIPLPHDIVLDKLNGVEVKKYIRDMLYVNPKLQKMVAEKKMDLMDIPIISYCYDEGCEADNYLQGKLNQIGFKNVKLFSHGIEGWKKVYGIK